MPAGRCASAAARTARAISVASAGPMSNAAAPESSRLASRMSLTIRASRSDSPAITASIPLVLLVAEHDVLAPERHRSAVDRRQRRAELVRDGRDEVAPQLLDRSLLGQIAERVDGAVGELCRRQREPELPVGTVDGERLRPLAGLVERPAGERVGSGRPGDVAPPPAR